MNFLIKRLPKWDEVQLALAAVVFFVHSWSVRGFLHEVPSFLLYFRVGQILAIFFYMMAVALLESVIMTASLLLLSVITPAKWFRQGLAYKSFLTSLVAAFAMTKLEYALLIDTRALPPASFFYAWSGITVAVWIALLLLAHYIRWFRKIAMFITERISVFAYLYIPLGMIGLLVILFRNI